MRHGKIHYLEIWVFAIEILGSSQSWRAVNVSDDKSHHTFLSFLGLDGRRLVQGGAP